MELQTGGKVMCIQVQLRAEFVHGSLFVGSVSVM
jgi:hypothetical protein